MRSVLGVALLSASGTRLGAGDLLRRGHAGASSSWGAPGASAGTGGVDSTRATLGVQDSLRRSAAASGAVRAMQAAARTAAAALTAPRNLGPDPNHVGQLLPDVPDGLANPRIAASGATPSGPGLRVAVDGQGNPLLWQGAGLPSTPTIGSNQVTITQTQQQALLQWETLDIGKNTTLIFDQSAAGTASAQWIAFNYVRDPSGRPSQIMGKLLTVNGQIDARGNPQVGGQVYVLNANGILFGGSSQVNVGALVASSLPVNTNLIQRGLLNNPGDQFLFSAIALPAASSTPAFDPKVAAAGIGPVQTPYPADGGSADRTSYGDVVVQPGAVLSAPSSAGNVGGRIALVGPNVTNAGTIETPDGQAILAAGLQVGLAASGDPNLRGLNVYVGQVSDPSLSTQAAAGVATNTDATIGGVGPSRASGLIDAPRAEVLIAGKTVNQLGFIDSSTSVSYNGRIDLTAAYNAISNGGNTTTAGAVPFFFLKTGSVLLGANSTTQILPELTSTGTVTGSALALRSQINLQGNNIILAGSDYLADPGIGALMLAPNAVVTVQAGDWQFTAGGPSASAGIALSNTSQQFVYDGGKITVGAGGSVDVSGSEGVAASVAENIISVQLLGPQLANSPLQKNGPLRGQTIDVDIRQHGTYNGQPWVGTPLADASGYVGLIQRTVGELTINGGTVNLSAGGPVTLEPGASINVSSGWIDYAGADIKTTKLLAGDGRIVDIARAAPDAVYQGIYTGVSTVTDPKWGVTQTTTSSFPLSTHELGYIESGDGGTLSIIAPTMSLTGGSGLIGEISPGARQLNPYSRSALLAASLKTAGIDPQVWNLDSLPQLATLSLTFEMQYATPGNPQVFRWYSPAPPDIVFRSDTSASPTDPRALVLSSELTDPKSAQGGGFGNLIVDNSGDNNQIDGSGNIVRVDPATGKLAPLLFGAITVEANPADPANLALQTAPSGSISFDAGNLVVGGSLVAPGGQLKLAAHDFWGGSAYNFSNLSPPAYDSTRGNFILAGGVTLSTAGLVVDGRTQQSPGGEEPLVTIGGSVAIGAETITLGTKSIVNVDGGAAIGATGKVTYSAGGSISLLAGVDPKWNSIYAGASAVDLAFAGAAQANSAIPADLKPLQGYSGSVGGTLILGVPLAQVGERSGTTPPLGMLQLQPGFFSAGGFSTFAVTGLGSVGTTGNASVLTGGAGSPDFFPALYVTPGTQITPRVQQLQIITEASGFTRQVISPPVYQVTPVSLSFGALGVQTSNIQGFNGLVARGDLLLGAGSLIKTDPQTNSSRGVSLSGQTVAVLGTVIAPGGTITITGAADSTAIFAGTAGVPTIDLGSKSVLSTAGVTLLAPDFRGVVAGQADYVESGSVLAGGSITVNGNIAAEAGAVLDVSGWSDVKDPGGLLFLAPSFSGRGLPQSFPTLGTVLVPTVVESDGGRINFIGRQELFVDSALKGAAGGANASGATLSITCVGLGATASTLQVIQSGPTMMPRYYGLAQTAIGHAVPNPAGIVATPQGYFAANSFAAGGFASLALHGVVTFEGPVNIAAAGSLSVGDGGLIYADGPVNLSASYIALGQPYAAAVPPGELPPVFQAPASSGGGPVYFAPTYGSGQLTVTAGTSSRAGLIDLGNLDLQQIGRTTLAASGGDIRGFGTLDMAGDLTISAGQVYAPTAETFTVAVYNYSLPGDPRGTAAHPGQVTLSTAGAGAHQIPLSAGSTVNIFGAVINQGGVLWAPMGTINLGWDGAGSSPLAVDPITNAAIPTTQNLILGQSGLTSVSASRVDPLSGQSFAIPDGLVLNGISWIDPTGNDITTAGPTPKSVNLSAASISVSQGAVIDTSGGGDLYAYQFVPGTGGTVDILSAQSTSVAVLPGYQPVYAPDTAFNSNSGTTTLNNFAAGDLGYASVDANGQNRLAVGENIRIDLSNGSGPQTYTVLPARYALLPGAYLVTPMNGGVPSSRPDVQADGSTVAAGYEFNAFSPSNPLASEFKVASAAVVHAQAQYSNFSANSFFAANAQSAGSAVPPLPVDAGQLNVTATGALALQGLVSAAPGTGGRGGLIGIDSTEDIIINKTGSGLAAGTLYLSAAELSNFNAGSLLVGGTSTAFAGGESVTTTVANLTVDNAGDPLFGSDIILVANNLLTLSAGAEVAAAGGVSSTPALVLQVGDSIQLQPAPSLSGATSSSTLSLARGGTAIAFPLGTPPGDTITSTVAALVTLANGSTTTLAKNTATTLAAGSAVTLSGPGQIIAGVAKAGTTGSPVSVRLGDGALLRVGSSASAPTARIGVASSTAPALQIRSGARVTGASVTLDSTDRASVAGDAFIGGGAIAVSSGQISVVFDNMFAGAPPSSSLVLAGTVLTNLQTNANGLSLLSYSSIDTYGAGTIGSSGYTSLALHAGEIRGFDAGANGQVMFSAQMITLDNIAGATNPGPVAGTVPTGALVMNAGTLLVGVNRLAIDEFTKVTFNATNGVLALGTGGLTTPANLTFATPVVTAAAAAMQDISAGGKLELDSLANGGSAPSPGLGAILTLTGSSVAINNEIVLPSGNLTLRANGMTASGIGAGVVVTGTLDVGGTEKTFNGAAEFTDGGAIDLISANGSVAIVSGAHLSVAASTGGGRAGTLSVSAPSGKFMVASATTGAAGSAGATVPTLDGRLGTGGTAGVFSLDILNLSVADGGATTSLGGLEADLTAGGFAQSQSIRVRKGDLTIDGALRASNFNLSADVGSIDVTGTVDASGATGGAIDLAASGSITLEAGSTLTAKGQNFSDAGVGGSVTLEAGSYTGQSVAHTNTRDPNSNDNGFSKFSSGVAVVDIKTGSTIDLSVVNNRALELNSSGASSATIPVANLGVFFPSGTPGNDQISLTSDGWITTAGGVTTNFAAAAAKPYKTALPLDSTVSFAQAGGVIAFASGAGGSIPFRLPASVNLALVNGTDITAEVSAGTLHLRAPQVTQGGIPVDIQINPISGNIVGVSRVMIEGFQVFDLTPAGGLITDASAASISQPFGGLIGSSAVNVEASVQDNGALFAGGTLSTGKTVAGNSAAILKALVGKNAGLQSLISANPGAVDVEPGAEIVDRTGDLTLSSTWDLAGGALNNGTGDPALASNWTLSGMAYRFGPNLAPGFLTLRAAGNLIFGVDANGSPVSLSDGFTGYDGADNSLLWQATLLPGGVRSWSFKLVSGADFSSADFRQVGGPGSVLLGPGTLPLQNSALNATVGQLIPLNYQVIRTGTGDVSVYSGGDVQILNNLATIYTAGSQAAPLANFDSPQMAYPAQYSSAGGDVTIVARGNIEHLGPGNTADSSKELPINWLNRQGWIDPQTGQFGFPGHGTNPADTSISIDSTTWWVDYSNFLEGVGALGGGNVSLIAGKSIHNVDAAVPTNGRTTRQTSVAGASGLVVDRLAAHQTTFELGGGDLIVRAGQDIDGGVYYVERGDGVLAAGGSIYSNSTRVTVAQNNLSSFAKAANNPNSWLPTTLFLGDGGFSLSAKNNLLIGSVANPFLLPQSSANGINQKDYFSTLAEGDSVAAISLTGSVTFKDNPYKSGVNGATGSLADWLSFVLLSTAGTAAYQSEPWLSLVETDTRPFPTVASLMPSSLSATAFTGDVNLEGALTLSPAAAGQLVLAAAGSINGFQPNGASVSTGASVWASGMINLSDANPNSIPGVNTPLALSFPDSGQQGRLWEATSSTILNPVNGLFAESGSVTGTYAVIQTKQALHGPVPLHMGDPNSVVLDAATGDISGLTLFAGKPARVAAAKDITDIALYVQNNAATDITAVLAGRDIISYDPNSQLRIGIPALGGQFASTSTTPSPATGAATAGDLQIGGLGTLEVLAGRNLNLGVGQAAPDGTAIGISSIGNTRNPSLPFGGADVVAAAGISGLDSGELNFSNFLANYVDPVTGEANAKRYLPELAEMLGVAVPIGGTPDSIWKELLAAIPASQQAAQKDLLALDVFYLALRDAGRDHNDPNSANVGKYTAGYAAIGALLPDDPTNLSGVAKRSGNLSMSQRLIETTNGGNIAVFVPQGQLTVGLPTDPQKPDQGILTEFGGNISIYAHTNVNLGTSRIFTLHGGNVVIWSTVGNIAAGSGSKTVHAAPPTRVLIDPQSADVQNDLAGLATGAGIGVLATLANVAPAAVDLIAPAGTIDAGDAGIRASGSISISALHVLNASNIQAGGATTGVPTAAAPNIGGLAAASSAASASSSAANQVATRQQTAAQSQQSIVPSIIEVEVLGYGGGEGEVSDAASPRGHDSG